MESPQPDIVNGGPKLAQTPELPPPHLLLDVGVKQPVLPGVPDAGEPEESEQQPQQSTEPSEQTSIPEPPSEGDPTSAGTTEVRSSASSVKEDRPRSRGTPEARKPKSPPAAKEEEVVERRRKRVPSAPRASSGIPRLSGGNAEPTRRTGRTVSESRQRPKSELSTTTRSGKSATSRSANFGYNRRPHSTVDGSRGAELPTSPTGDLQRTPRSSTSSLYSSSGGRRMEIKSKIGSLDNAKHQPGGGNVRIFDQKKKFDDVSSKCGSKDFIKHKPAGGNIQIHDEKLSYRQKAQSRVGSLEKANHKPAGGDVKIDNQKLKWEAKSKVGSLDNAKHKASGGEKKIENVKLDFREKATSKVGSLDNAKHVPQGGDRKIYNEKLAWDAKSKVGSLENAKRKPAGGNVKIFSEVLPWVEPPMSKAEQIKSYKEQYTGEPKVGSLDNTNHNPGGGSTEIFSERLPWLKFNRPNLPSAERRRIIKKGNLDEFNSGAFDRGRQWRYDPKVKARSGPASLASAPESNAFDPPRKTRPIEHSNHNSLPAVTENGANAKNEEAAAVETAALDVTDGPEAANDNRPRQANSDGPRRRANGGAATSPRHPRALPKYDRDRAEGKSDKSCGSATSEPAKKKEDFDFVDGPAMPTSSTSQIGDHAPSYNSTRAMHADDDWKQPTPQKSPQLDGDSPQKSPRKSSRPEGDSPRKSPRKSSQPHAELATETWLSAQAKESPGGNKENQKEGRKESRGLKDLHLTEGYAERFKLLPPRPEAEASVRLSPLHTDPPPMPEWKKKAQLKIDYDRDGHEMTVKTNLRASTRLPRVCDDGGAAERPEGYAAEHIAKSQRSSRRPEKKPRRIGAENLERLLPSLDRLLDVKEPPSKVYSLYSHQEKKASPPRGRARRSNASSEPLQPIQGDFGFDLEIDFQPDSCNHYDEDGGNPALFPERYPAPYKFDRLAVDAAPLDVHRASAMEANDQLPPLPADFAKSDGSAATASSVSLHESAAGHRKRVDFLRWRPGEVPFDKRSSSKPSYAASLSPQQPSKAVRKSRKRTEGFADRFSHQRGWFEEYNERMRNRLSPEKVTAKSLEQSTFALY